MPSYHACEQCQRGIHGECGGVDDHCACLACNSDLTDDEIADAPSTGEQLTDPDEWEDDNPFDFDAWVRSGIEIGPGRYVHWLSDSDHDEPAMFIEYHPDGQPGHEGKRCAGSVGFVNVNPPTGLHTLVSRDPLHVEASVLCRICGNHGWIRNGRWHAA